MYIALVILLILSILFLSCINKRIILKDLFKDYLNSINELRIPSKNLAHKQNILNKISFTGIKLLLFMCLFILPFLCMSYLMKILSFPLFLILAIPLVPYLVLFKN